MLVGAASHKSLADEHPLLRFYYTAPYALFTVCLLNEALLLAVFLLPHEAAFDAALAAWPGAALLRSAAGALTGWLGAPPASVLRAAVVVCFPVFALKQVFSVLQLVTAARRVAAVDERKRRA